MYFYFSKIITSISTSSKTSSGRLLSRKIFLFLVLVASEDNVAIYIALLHVIRSYVCCTSPVDFDLNLRQNVIKIRPQSQPKLRLRFKITLIRKYSVGKVKAGRGQEEKRYVPVKWFKTERRNDQYTRSRALIIIRYC